MSDRIVELRFPGIAATGPPYQWDGTEAEATWEAVNPRWDAEFYDGGFHRALSYARTVLSRNSPEDTARVDALVEPIIDRLSAICEYFIGTWPHEFDLDDEVTCNSWMTGEATRLHLTCPKASSHRVRDQAAAEVVVGPVREGSGGGGLEAADEHPKRVLDRIRCIIKGFIVSISWWRDATAVRIDSEDWLLQRTGTALSAVTLGQYLSLLEPLAQGYTERLDRVAPVVTSVGRRRGAETLLRSLTRWFWKRR